MLIDKTSICELWSGIIKQIYLNYKNSNRLFADALVAEGQIQSLF